MEIDLPEVQGKVVTEKDPQIDSATFELDTFCDKMGLKLESPELLKDISSCANVSLDIASFRYTGYHGIQILWPAARLKEEIRMQTMKEANRSQRRNQEKLRKRQNEQGVYRYLSADDYRL